MPQGKSKFLPTIFSIVDTLMLLSSLFVAKYFTFREDIFEINSNDIFILFLPVFWIIISFKYKLYEINRVLFIHRNISKNIGAVAVFILVSTCFIFFSTSDKFSRFLFINLMLVFGSLMVISRIFFVLLIKEYRKKGYNYREVVIVGLNKKSAKLIESMYLNRNYGYKILGIFTDDDIYPEFQNYYKGGLSEVIPFLKNNTTREILISLSTDKSELINYLLMYSDNNMIRSSVVPWFSEYLPQTFSIQYFGSVPIMKIRKEPLQSFSNRFIKRFFDFTISLLILIFIISWMFPIIAIIIKLTSKGNVFFVQERTGKEGNTFKCFKFRSMFENKESNYLQASKNDSRVTPFGAFMRKTSIDELPQIFNVLVNQMSLVGPRPHMLKHTKEYRNLVDKFMVRHFAKPGITGWAQINGFRGETKEIKDMKNRAEADIWYIENWNFILDLKILVSTPWIILFEKDKNAY